MPFERRLSPAFVGALNKLYRDPDSWWKRLVDDPDVFIAVRVEALNAYSQGGSVGRITFENGSVCLRTHIEYLSLPGAQDSYVNLTAEPAVELHRPVAWNHALFVQHLDQIKQRPRRFTGAERVAENEVACSRPCVIDMEAAFSTDGRNEADELERLKESDKGRLDLVALDSQFMRLVFTEVKLFVNSDIRSRGRPKVCDQLCDYHEFLRENQAQIKAAYSEVLSLLHALEGESLRPRRCAPGELTVDTTPRLLIVGFDGSQLTMINNQIKPRIVEGIAGLLTSFTPDHVVAVGRAGNVTQAHLVA